MTTTCSCLFLYIPRTHIILSHNVICLVITVLATDKNMLNRWCGYKFFPLLCEEYVKQIGYKICSIKYRKQYILHFGYIYCSTYVFVPK